MDAVPYPASLPGPISAPFKRGARTQFSEARGLGRLRLRDKTGSADVVWVIPFDKSGVWNDWYFTALDRGQMRTVIPLPGETGIVARVCQFSSPLKREVLAGAYRMSATVQVIRIAP